MPNSAPLRIKSITEFHQLKELPKPKHPLISLVNMETMKLIFPPNVVSASFDFYYIALKRNFKAKIKYGQHEYESEDGLMTFMGPGQVIRVEVVKQQHGQPTGWMLFIHPDFLWKTPLAKKIKEYEYFGYSVYEGLFLSEEEEQIITHIIRNIEREYCANIDRFSQDIIIAQLETLLTYADRFYQRQFLTRKISSHKILEKLEDLLDQYFKDDLLTINGIPSVIYVSNALNISPNYLSSLLKALTGKSTLQHIHDKLIEKAKERLSTTDLSVSEIAYELGFDYPQTFSKLFKTYTNLSPLAFRQSFN